MDGVMNEDARDLSAARSGGSDGHAAFARIYDRHAGVVLALCRQHVTRSAGGDAEAEDALQETFIRAYRMLDRVEDPGQLRAWLYAIARHVCAERRRSAARRMNHEARGAQVHMSPAMEYSPIPGGNAAGAGSPGGGGRHDAPSAGAEHREQLALLDRALDALPDRERLAIHLYYLEPDPVAAASSVLGLSRSGFYKLLTKAREHLGALMAQRQTT
jgi:RNA polymerase sigma-70 factor (ECF subfamily)